MKRRAADNESEQQEEMNGSWEIIEEWMKTYGTRITRFAAGMVGDEEAAQDIAQEVFIRAYRHHDRFRGDSSPYTYLYRIARNLALDHLRIQRQKASREIRESDRKGEDPQSLLLSLPDHDLIARPEAVALRSETLEAVRDAIKQLPSHCRETAVLFYLDDQDIGEISRLTRTPPGTVKSRLFRARKSLSRTLAEVL